MRDNAYVSQNGVDHAALSTSANVIVAVTDVMAQDQIIVSAAECTLIVELMALAPVMRNTV